MYYQVGGSLAIHSPCYIPRSSDRELYQALKRGDFCYVLNARQMGKSSLMVRTRARLQAEGDRCTILDMSNIGSENITPLQWYKGIVKDLFRGFKLRRKVDFKSWWADEEDLSLLQRLSRFIEDILLVQCPEENLVIFIDEIDSILSLPFSVDDFFALIRSCYNQRAVNPNYGRLRFAILGVATPSDLIRDRQRTPFNIGTPIPLHGFTLDQCYPLINGLTLPGCNTSSILREILNWTNGQPFLTQKLCQLVMDASEETVSGHLVIPPGQEAYWIKTLVQEQLLTDWEYQDEPEHFRTIRNRILNSPERAGRLLGIYQQILHSTHVSCSAEDPLTFLASVSHSVEGKSTPAFPTSPLPVRADNSPEQTELLLSGLVIKQKGTLQIKSRLYAEIFNALWVKEQLGTLRPYSQLLDAWVQSGYTDESRLLRGNALKDAQQWSQGKQLSDLDHRFLASSVECDRLQVQQALEAERAQAVKAQLTQERQAAQVQRRSLKIVSGALCLVIGLGIVTFWQYRLARQSERNARLSTIKALASSAEGNFASHRHLDALVQVIQAKESLLALRKDSSQALEQGLSRQVDSVLRQVVYGATEVNRITTDTGIREVAIAPDNSFIAAAGADGTIYRWLPNGQIQSSIAKAHATEINTIAISPDSQWIASGSADKTIKIWSRDGHWHRTLGEHTEGIRKVLFTGDGRLVSSGRSKVKLWTLEGELVNEWDGKEAIAVNPQNNTIVMSIPEKRTRHDNRDGPGNGKGDEGSPRSSRIVVYDLDDSTHTSLADVAIPLPAIRMAFSPDGRHLVFTDREHQMHIWSMNRRTGQLTPGPEVSAHTLLIRNIAISPDSQFITTASADNTVKLWDMNGTLHHTFQGHQAVVWHSVFFAGSDRILSAADDGTLKIWQWQVPWLTHLPAWGRRIRRVAFSPDGQQIAAASQAESLVRWTSQGIPLNPIPAEYALFNLAFSTDGQDIVAGTGRGNVLVWRTTNTTQSTSQDDSQPMLKMFHAPGVVWGVAFSPDGQWIASASEDATIKLWSRDGTLVQTLTDHREAMRDVVFSPDSRFLASSSTDGTINLWALAKHSHQDIATAAIHNSQNPPSTSLSPPLEPPATLLRTFTNQQGTIRGLDFSPDGRYLASGTVNSSINIWNMDDASAPAYVIPRYKGKGSQGDGHRGAIWDVAFSADGQFLASASMDGTVKLWAMPGAIAQQPNSQLTAPRLVRTLTGHNGPVRGVAFSPDGKAIASASDDKNVILWHLNTILDQDELLYACRWIDDYWHYQLATHPPDETATALSDICSDSNQ